MRPWLQRAGDSLSQLANVWLLNGEADESISGRAYRRGVLEGATRWRYACRAINALFWWQGNHCRGAYRADIERARVRVATAGRRERVC